MLVPHIINGKSFHPALVGLVQLKLLRSQFRKFPLQVEAKRRNRAEISESKEAECMEQINYANEKEAALLLAVAEALTKKLNIISKS